MFCDEQYELCYKGEYHTAGIASYKTAGSMVPVEGFWDAHRFWNIYKEV